MDTTGILKRLDYFNSKVNSGKYNIDELTDIVSVDFFTFILDQPVLQSILDDKIFYFSKLGEDQEAIKAQELLIEIISQTLSLFNNDLLQSITDSFDCRHFIHCEESKSVSAIEAVEIMKNRKNFYLVGKGTKYEVGMQYATFENLNKLLSKIASTDPKIYVSYSTLQLSYQITKIDYDRVIEGYYIRNHIQSFERFLVWVLDKVPYPPYMFLFGKVPKGKRLWKLEIDEVAKIVSAVIDDMVITLQDMPETNTLNIPEEIVVRFKTLALGKQGTIFENNLSVGKVDTSRENLQKKYGMLFKLMSEQSKTGKDNTIVTTSDIEAFGGMADYESLYTKINNENLQKTSYVITKHGAGYMLKSRPIKDNR